MRDIARKTELNENSATRFLKQLEEEGALVSKREGNLKKYYLNSSHCAKPDAEYVEFGGIGHV